MVKNPPADAGDTGLILINYILHIIMGFPGGSAVRNLPAMHETWIRSLGWEDPLEKGMATQSSIFAWRIPWTVDPGRARVHGVTKSQT